MPRTVRPEILDSLTPDDPEALRNRRDLHLINRLMGNTAWFARVLPRQVKPGERALEIGAGTGELGAALKGKIEAAEGIDLWPQPAPWPKGWAWHQTNLCTFPDYGRYAVVFGNMILHQFDDAALLELGRRLASASRALVFCEPARRSLSVGLLHGMRAARLISRVSLHDGSVSVQAGFCRGELPALLGLSEENWELSSHSTVLGAYRMVAVRRGDP